MFFQQTEDTPQEVDFNPGMIWEKLDSWMDGFVRLAPNLLVGIVNFFSFYFAAKFIGHNLANEKPHAPLP